MFTKLFTKVTPPPSPPPQQHQEKQHQPQGNLAKGDLDPRIAVHYGIPATASILAFDPIQRLLAVATLDGRIKVIGSDNIECLLTSPRKLSFKNLEFLQNQGFLVSVLNDNDIQVWDLEQREIVAAMYWESNITAFSVISGTPYMYIGDEHGMVSVVKYDAHEGTVRQLPYHLSADFLAVAASISVSDNHSVVGVLPQPCSFGNRLLIAYENGLIILCDVSQRRVLLRRSNKDLQPEDENSDAKPIPFSDEAEQQQVDKEISSLCWASSNGSILAVGYVDGDIVLWNLLTAATNKDRRANKSLSNNVKLQLSSGDRRLPVTVLRWNADKSLSDCAGRLFVYGGDDIGSEEVLTVLQLDWSSGLEHLKCISSVALALNGSFADMILLPHAGAMESSEAVLCVLTNPGQMHVYDEAYLSTLMYAQEKNISASAVQFPTAIPTVEPLLTIGKLYHVCAVEKFSRTLSEIVSTAKVGAVQRIKNIKWPVTGGVPSQLSAEDNNTKRLYVGGYHDGSVRIWDSTYTSLILIFLLESKVEGTEISGVNASVSALDFWSPSLSLAIGNKCGLVRLYRLIEDSDETNVCVVTETGHKVSDSHQGNGAKCTAIFSLLKSCVHSLEFIDCGARLVVGYESGQVAMLDVCSQSVLFLTDSISGSSSPIVSTSTTYFLDANSVKSSPEGSRSESSDASEERKMIILTEDAHIAIRESSSGNIISSYSIDPERDLKAISMHVLEDFDSVSQVARKKQSQKSSENNKFPEKHVEKNKLEVEYDMSTSGQNLMDGLVLISCRDVLQLHTVDSLIQGECASIWKVNLVDPCCWTTTFKKDGKDCGLVVLYSTGVIEIRSLPNLEIVGKSSLVSILRWNFKTSMERTMASFNNGQIALVNGSEFAIISLLKNENDFRIRESLPCLHDKVLAAAADAAISFSLKQKEKQSAPSGILGGIIKGLKADKLEHVDTNDVYGSNFSHLERVFNPRPVVDPTIGISNHQEVVELNIDDIQLDEPVPSMSSSSSHHGKVDEEGKMTEREILFEGAASDAKPKLRTPEEIMAKYRKPEDAAAAAARAKERLAERQERLERLSKRTEELQSGAEDFANLASELARRMENRKWWKL